MIKFKEAGNGYFIRISIDEEGKETSRTPSFNHGKPGTSAFGYFKEMQEWEAAGNKIEPQFTAEEFAERESEEAEKAKTAYIGLRKSEYPDPMEYNDSLVKQMSEDETVRSEGLAQRDKYFYDCQAVKDKYPKP